MGMLLGVIHGYKSGSRGNYYKVSSYYESYSDTNWFVKCYQRGDVLRFCQLRPLVRSIVHIVFYSGTVETHKSLHHKSLRFAIFWEIFQNCQLKTLLTSKKSSNRYGFLKVFFVTIYGSRLYIFFYIFLYRCVYI